MTGSGQADRRLWGRTASAPTHSCNESPLDAIGSALERSHIAIRQETELRRLREHYATLSRREREVMALVVLGLSNKQVDDRLCISEMTVKAHRGQVMRKMGVGSFAQLVNVAAKLEPAQLDSTNDRNQ